jgi:hypothetical protein
MCDALVRHGSEYSIVRWIRATLEGHVAVTTLNDIFMRFAISRGCPQGGVLLPLLWCLVVNDLITRLSGSGGFIQGDADGICLLAVGKFPNTVSGLMQWALSTTEIWCSRSDCQLILIRLGSLHLLGIGNSRGSLNHSFLGLN